MNIILCRNFHNMHIHADTWMYSCVFFSCITPFSSLKLILMPLDSHAMSMSADTPLQWSNADTSRKGRSFAILLAIRGVTPSTLMSVLLKARQYENVTKPFIIATECFDKNNFGSITDFASSSTCRGTVSDVLTFHLQSSQSIPAMSTKNIFSIPNQNSVSEWTDLHLLNLQRRSSIWIYLTCPFEFRLALRILSLSFLSGPDDQEFMKSSESDIFAAFFPFNFRSYAHLQQCFQSTARASWMDSLGPSKKHVLGGLQTRATNLRYRGDRNSFEKKVFCRL